MCKNSYILENEQVDDLQLNDLLIIQKKDNFSYSMDAVLLSDFIDVKKNETMLDLCSGTGVIPLLCYGKYDLNYIKGLEIQEEMVHMANRSVKLNNISNIEFLCGDINDYKKIFDLGSFDIVSCNPPYMEKGKAILNPNDKMAISRHEILIDLDKIVEAMSKLVKVSKRVYMIHRADRLSDVILSFNKHELKPRKIRFIQSYVNTPPNLFMIEGIRKGKNKVSMQPNLVIYEKKDKYTKEVLDIYGKK